MNYEAALRYIKDCTKFGIKLGLERISTILERLGNPQQQFRVIHVAGTNGKGSTVAMLESVLMETGLKVGRFTSPHLSSYRERFVVAGELMTKELLAELVLELQPILESVVRDGFGESTEFEVGTALAFIFFAREKVDLAIIEVGMGGRFDATNVVKPSFSIITHIALDHQQYLGDTLEKIAFEKAGIIKPAIPVVIGVQEPEVTTYLVKIANERGAPVKLAAEINVSKIDLNETGTFAVFNNTSWGEISLTLGLLGRHQVLNCLNVLAGIEILQQSGVKINREQVKDGLTKAIWPGRLERIKSVTRLKLYLDGAHNPDGIGVMVKTIQELYPGQKVDLLVGILNNRPLLEMAALLVPVVRRVIVTSVPDPKSASVTELAIVFRKLNVLTIEEPSPEKALQLLLTSDNQVATACGSLYLIGFLRSLLLNLGD